MRRVLVELWSDMTTGSSPEETLHAWGMIAVTHAVMSAAVVEICNYWVSPGVVLSVGVGVAYFFFKEVAFDLRKGGSTFLDSVVDTIFIVLGTFLWAVPNPNFTLLFAVAVGVMLKAALDSRK